MSGSPGDRTPPDPNEVFIVGADGRRDGAPGLPVSTRSHAGAVRRWAAITVAGVLIFGLGIAVGRHIGDGAAGNASGGQAPTVPGPSSVSSTVTASSHRTATGSAGTTIATTTAGAAPTAASAAMPAPTARAAPWPTARGACNSEVPLPLLSGIDDLRARTGLQLLAGSDTRRFNVDAGTRGAPLFALHRGEYVSQLGVDSKRVVAIVSDCRGYPPVRVVRRSPDGTVHTVTPRRSGYQVGSLITGGTQVWLTLYHAQTDATSYPDDAVLLHATDGSGTTLTLPEGFSPVAGSGHLIVGNWFDQLRSANGPIQLYDVRRRAIVAQLGGADVRYVVDHGYIMWMPQACQSCPVHRYHIARGTESVFRVTVPPSISWQAISPDGTRVAGVQYHRRDDPRFAIDHPGGPTGIVVMNLATRSVTPLPGIELAPKSPLSLVFSPDSQWLAVGIDQGRTGTVLLYDRTMNGPLDPGLTVPGPVLWTIPLALAS